MSISPLFITFVVFSVAGFSPCFAADQQYEECLLPLRCGSGQQVFPNISYPFWGSDIGKPSLCGSKTEFQLSCKNNQTLTLVIKNLILRVISTNLENKTITVADQSLLEGGCPTIWNFTGDDQYFTLNHNTEMIDLFDCPQGPADQPTLPSSFSCLSTGSWTTYHVFRSSNPTPNCLKVGEIPMLGSARNDLYQSNDSAKALNMALEKGFELRYSIEDRYCRGCSISGGICGSESGSGNFQCLCQDKPQSFACNINVDHDAGHSFKVKIGIMIACGVLVATLIAGSLFHVISR